MPDSPFLQRLKERKLVQWALAYLAGAWVISQGIEVFAEPWSISPALQRTIHVLLVIGLFVALVLAWYHGEKGRQRVSGPELLMVAALLVIAGGVLSMLGRESPAVLTEGEPASVEVEDVAAVLNRMPAIAVLPFENRSDLSSDQHFTDGIQDELLTRLQRVQGLRVISRTSSEAYRDTNKTIPEIAGELSVRYVLEGSVQRAGDEVRIIAQLIDVETEDHIWSDVYDRVVSTENLFDIQSEIVRTVAGQLNIELREEERLRAARQSTADLSTYQLYLRATPLGRRSEEAIPLLQEAVKRDPGFVAAHVALARHLAGSYQVIGLRSEERAAAARAAAQRAVELAPESEDVQLAMGIYLFWVERDYQNALDWLSRASGSLLGDYEYHRYRAYVERAMGRWGQALASKRAAVSLSPRSPEAWTSLGTTYLRLRRYAEAEDALLEAQRLGDTSHVRLAELTWHRDGTTDDWQPYLESDRTGQWAWAIPMTEGRHEDAMAALQDLPDILPGAYFWYPHALLEAETLWALGQREAARRKYQDAANILENLVGESPDDERYRASLAWAYAGLGMREKAMREARRSVAIMPRERHALNGPEFLFDLAAVHARFGQVDEALEVLEDLLSAPSRFSPNMLEDHFRLRPIQDDPRFQALMDRERGRVF